jgi:predicted O-methyltransferase YrrM
MKARVIASLLIVLAGTALGQCAPARSQRFEKPPLGKDEAEKKILNVLAEARSSGRVHLEVPVSDGRMLRLLAESIDAKTVVEIGTSTGYSGLWFCLALQKTGGRLITFEMDEGRAAQAQRHFEQAGVDKMVTIVRGDAHQNISRLKPPVDLVFIDADKGGYVDYLKKLLPLVRPGGLILAHNVEMTPDYVNAVSTDPELETLYYLEGARLGITLKKR